MTSPDQAAVPAFNQYYAPVRSAPKPVQDYFAWFRSEVREGRAPDVEGNLSYLFAYVYELIWQFDDDRDFEALSRGLRFMRERYTGTNVESYIDSWSSDAAMVMERWDEAWESRRRVDANFVRTVGVKTFSRRLEGRDIASLVEGSLNLTAWGNARRDDVLEAAESIAHRIHDELGANYVDAFCAEYEERFMQLSDLDIQALVDDLDNGINVTRARRDMKVAAERGDSSSYETARVRRVFNGVPSSPARMSISFSIDIGENGTVSVVDDSPPRHEPPTAHLVGISRFSSEWVKLRSRWIVREAENAVRVEEGVPQIGDGWISETELFNRVRDAFGDLRVQRHARPDWLAPQHLDVYLPAVNIGIEFQGEQHYTAVEIFGGEEGLRRTQFRDRKKRRRCAANGCHLIEVREGYDFDALAAEIRGVVEARRSLTG